jgi:hypothetical protein
MIVLAVIGAPLAVAIGLAIALDLRGRRSRTRGVQGDRIDAAKAESLPRADRFDRPA